MPADSQAAGDQEPPGGDPTGQRRDVGRIVNVVQHQQPAVVACQPLQRPFPQRLQRQRPRQGRLYRDGQRGQPCLYRGRGVGRDPPHHAVTTEAGRRVPGGQRGLADATEPGHGHGHYSASGGQCGPQIGQHLVLADEQVRADRKVHQAGRGSHLADRPEHLRRQDGGLVNLHVSGIVAGRGDPADIPVRGDGPVTGRGVRPVRRPRGSPSHFCWMLVVPSPVEAIPLMSPPAEIDPSPEPDDSPPTARPPRMRTPAQPGQRPPRLAPRPPPTGQPRISTTRVAATPRTPTGSPRTRPPSPPRPPATFRPGSFAPPCPSHYGRSAPHNRR